MAGLTQTTQSELEQIFAKALPSFFEYVRQHSARVGTIERVSTLDNVHALTAIYTAEGVEKTVLVPLSLIPSGKSTTAGVPMYSGTVSEITAGFISLQNPKHVLYDTTNNVFVATQDDALIFGASETYANNWGANEAEGILAADQYGTPTEKGIKPILNRIYIDTRGKTIGFWDKSTDSIIGIPCSISTNEINNICE